MLDSCFQCRVIFCHSGVSDKIVLGNFTVSGLFSPFGDRNKLAHGKEMLFVLCFCFFFLTSASVLFIKKKCSLIMRFYRAEDTGWVGGEEESSITFSIQSLHNNVCVLPSNCRAVSFPHRSHSRVIVIF